MGTKFQAIVQPSTEKFDELYKQVSKAVQERWQGTKESIFDRISIISEDFYRGNPVLYTEIGKEMRKEDTKYCDELAKYHARRKTPIPIEDVATLMIGLFESRENPSKVQNIESFVRAYETEVVPEGLREPLPTIIVIHSKAPGYNVSRQSGDDYIEERHPELDRVTGGYIKGAENTKIITLKPRPIIIEHIVHHIAYCLNDRRALYAITKTHTINGQEHQGNLRIPIEWILGIDHERKIYSTTISTAFSTQGTRLPMNNSTNTRQLPQIKIEKTKKEEPAVQKETRQKDIVEIFK